MSAKLALHGGKAAVPTQIKPYNSIDASDAQIVNDFMARVVSGHLVLSGYLAGNLYGGLAVQTLENRFKSAFGVADAIACNSATSGLYAAYAACRDGTRRVLYCPPLTMAATATAAHMLDYTLAFYDVDETGGGNPQEVPHSGTDPVVITSLWGHPADINRVRVTHPHGRLIQDCAQSLWANANGRIDGVDADIAVYSFNVHKHVQCGEGGVVVVPRDTALARRIRRLINHGEVGDELMPGLNLRMTELTAVLAISQFDKSEKAVRSREKLAYALMELIPEPFKPIMPRTGCRSSWYLLPFLLPSTAMRTFAVSALEAERVPCLQGYSPLLNEMRTFKVDGNRECPRASDLEKRLLLIEMCSIDPTDEQLEQMGQGFRKVAEYLEGSYDSGGEPRAESAVV